MIEIVKELLTINRLVPYNLSIISKTVPER